MCKIEKYIAINEGPMGTKVAKEKNSWWYLLGNLFTRWRSLLFTFTWWSLLTGDRKRERSTRRQLSRYGSRELREVSQPLYYEFLCFSKFPEDCSDIFLVETRQWEYTHLECSGIRPKNRYKMAPCPRIFTIKVPKHQMQRENVCFHDIFKFHDCSFYRFLAIHNRVKLHCKAS